MHDLFSSMLPSGPAAWVMLIAVLVAGAAVVALIVSVLRGDHASSDTAAQMAVQMARMNATTEQLAAMQMELAGRLQQTQSSLDRRLEALSDRLGEGLLRYSERTHETLRTLHERLALIDRAQRTIAELSAEVSGLQDILGNKQARGAFGEVQLESLVASMLPADAFRLQATLGNGSRVDCLLQLPEPPGPIGVDAKFPLESYRALCDARDDATRQRAGRAFARDVLQHVRDIADKYILPGETADSALLFLPSEAVYAELHARFRDVVEESFRRKVWIVSPSTLWAMLNTLRAVLRDVRLRQQAQQIHTELAAFALEMGRLGERAAALQRHFEQVSSDTRTLRQGCEALAHRAARLDLGMLAEGGLAEGNLADKTVSSDLHPAAAVPGLRPVAPVPDLQRTDEAQA